MIERKRESTSVDHLTNMHRHTKELDIFLTILFPTLLAHTHSYSGLATFMLLCESSICVYTVHSSVCLNSTFECACNADVDDGHQDHLCAYTFDLLINFNLEPNEAFKRATVEFVREFVCLMMMMMMMMTRVSSRTNVHNVSSSNAHTDTDPWMNTQTHVIQ